MPKLRERCVPVMGSCLILIGMPGSGKTTLGREVSRKTGMAWVDTDFLLEAWWGMPLQTIRDRLGLDGFIRAEEELVSSLKFFMTVISTGGSVVYGPSAMDNLRKLGKIVYLQVDLETIRKRLKDMSSRGLAMKSGQDLNDIYTQRVPLYQEYADLVIDTDSFSPEKNVEQIIEWLEKLKK